MRYYHTVNTKMHLARRKKGNSGGNPDNSYKKKFYLVIFLILAATGLYVYLQIKVNSNSIFAKIYTALHTADTGKSSFLNNLLSGWNSKVSSIEKSVKPSAGEKKNPPPSQPVVRPETREIQIYLAKQEKNRALRMMPKSVNITVTDGKIMKESINTLLHYKSPESDIITSIPPKVELLDAYIENNVLILDFNRHFEYNKHGYIGLEVQIQQILWTITGINEQLSLSFLIEGRRKHKIGGEGMILRPFYSVKDRKKIISEKNITS
ncbi:MAG: hypothetical protein A2096_01445 [Spirochaetes bacterium GWF1_41_5]|nr:MAG: hypothetical protein A2096_01445 [Spirochaetes bacterium GWF1_41_5]